MNAGRRRGKRRSVERGLDGGQGREETREDKERRDAEERGEGEEKKKEKREWCACLGAKSWASRAQAWPRLTLERLRSEVIIEHEPPWGSQPSPLGACRRSGLKLPH